MRAAPSRVPFRTPLYSSQANRSTVRVMGHARISIDPAIMGGKACIAGTRVPVHVLLGHLASGAAESEELAGYPFLTADDLRAAIAYAADLAENEGVVAA